MNVVKVLSVYFMSFISAFIYCLLFFNLFFHEDDLFVRLVIHIVGSFWHFDV